VPRLNRISIVRVNSRERTDSREDFGQRKVEHDEEARTNIWPKSSNRLFQASTSPADAPITTMSRCGITHSAVPAAAVSLGIHRRTARPTGLLVQDDVFESGGVRRVRGSMTTIRRKAAFRFRMALSSIGSARDRLLGGDFVDVITGCRQSA
jgi:hypothetical protein